ncbi:MAG: UDP-N-acetylmuramoyl-L-alanyl-D-glutamate--2,6-diaminopimelate ligase [Thermoleophilia bacterium]
MKLAELVAVVPGAQLLGDPSTAVCGLAYHTADVSPGVVFFCVPGLRSDGHSFAARAAASGAAALVCERPVEPEVPRVLVPSVRRALALMAAHWFGDPSHELLVAGVTGTNGKTTTAHLIAGMVAAAGRQAALLGTVVNRIGGRDYPVRLTTAESLDLQRMFREMRDVGDEACALEISSHALALDRAVGIDFDAVVFTNLTRDHLDFHSDLDDYFAAKRRLFLPDGHRNGHSVAVVNVGDAYGRRLAAECAGVYGDDLWTYALADAELDGVQPAALARDVDLRAAGSEFTLEVSRLGVVERLTLRLAARFNVENALAAATTALALGLPIEAVREALAVQEGVPGRFESVRAGQSFDIVVDYSHTPDSLENALRAARAISGGRVLVVFGCGGDRDRGKRPLMGAIAVRLADRAFVTSDNPRSEDPAAIISEIVAGVPEKLLPALVIEQDRREAIRMAFREAQPGDLVVIAGKGHEQGQTIGDQRIPFDDRDVAHDVVHEMRAAG